MKKSFEDTLLESGVINKEQYSLAIEESRRTGLPLNKALIKLGILTEEDWAKFLSESTGIPFVDLTSYLIDPQVLKSIPEELAKKFKTIPLFKIRDILTIAVVDPRDIVAIDEIRMRSGCEIESVVATEKAINSAIDQYYGVTGTVEEVIKDYSKEILSETLEKFDETKLAEMADQPPIIKLVNMFIIQAVKERASDIHIEPEEKALRVRYRIDGVLHEVSSPPKHLEPALVSRIKVLSNMDISEKRRPQDGRFSLKMENREIDLRVSTFPTIYGENVVLRILDKSSLLFELSELGFSKDMQAQYEKLINQPFGILLVTGPTGCGKTTTLYASLRKIDTVDKNIITVEDPVEYHIGRVRQSQINPKAGLTFATGLRSILRQDPDVIMVGEVRDLETAEIAIQAALTGHLVFSTLHTNDAAGALTRLIDMGVESFLVASSVIGILAQRLVRRVCDGCKEEYRPSDELLKELDLLGQKEIVFWRGRGCKACRQTGYKGRIGLFELLTINEEIKRLIIMKSSSSEIKKSFAGIGMKTLREDGMTKVLQGITTLDEVLKATKEE